MQPRISVKRTWSDADVVRLSLEVCDGTSRVVVEAYAGLDWGTASARSLKAFGEQIHGGIFDLEAGKDGREYAGGAFRARFHWFRPRALLISTLQQGDFFEFKGAKVSTEATMFLRTELGLLDQFVAADGGRAPWHHAGQQPPRLNRGRSSATSVPAM
jgi:hypothetical protein